MGSQFKYLLLLQDYDIRSLTNRKTLYHLAEEDLLLAGRLQEKQAAISEIKATIRLQEEESRDLEFRQRQLEERQKKLQEKMDSAVFLSHEPALQKEWDGLAEKRNGLENEQLAILFAIDQLQNELAKNSQALEDLREATIRRKLAIAEQQRELQDQIETADQQGRILRGDIGSSLLKLYEFTKKSVSNPPFLCPASSAVCPACRMRLAKNFLTDLRQNPLKVAACDFCRRLLYVDEESIEAADHGNED